MSIMFQIELSRLLLCEIHEIATEKRNMWIVLTSLQKSNSTSKVISSFSMIITSMYKPHCPIQALHWGGIPKIRPQNI